MNNADVTDNADNELQGLSNRFSVEIIYLMWAVTTLPTTLNILFQSFTCQVAVILPNRPYTTRLDSKDLRITGGS